MGTRPLRTRQWPRPALPRCEFPALTSASGELWRDYAPRWKWSSTLSQWWEAVRKIPPRLLPLGTIVCTSHRRCSGLQSRRPPTKQQKCWWRLLFRRCCGEWRAEWRTDSVPHWWWPGWWWTQCHTECRTWCRSCKVHCSGQVELGKQTNQSINRLINQWVNQSINQSVNQSIRWSIKKSVNQSINQVISQPIS